MTKSKANAAWICVAVAAAGAGAGAARADEKADRAAITKVYARLSAAFKRDDMATAAAAMTSDFTMRLKSGQVFNKQQTVESYKANMAQMRRLSRQITLSPIKIQAFASKGGRASVVSYGVMTLKMPDRDGGLHTLQILTQTRDFWRRDGGAWKEYRTEEITSSARLDGKPVPVPGQ